MNELPTLMGGPPRVLLTAHQLQALAPLSAGMPQQASNAGVAFALPAGQWLAVVGPNAAGKSTMLQCLAGLRRPHAGRVCWSPSVKCAWLPQVPEADASMTVAEVVALGRMLHQGWWGWPRDRPDDVNAIELALDAVDMAWATDRPMATLSGGEQQRAHLARALATQAEVLLLDEPTAHLDAPHHRRLVRLIRRLTASGSGVITVLHELSLALMADRVLVMQAGQAVALGERDDPVVHRAIENVFEETIKIVLFDQQWIALPCP
jgi:iron complex transport system ATP-binding protein